MMDALNVLLWRVFYMHEIVNSCILQCYNACEWSARIYQDDVKHVATYVRRRKPLRIGLLYSVCW